MNAYRELCGIHLSGTVLSELNVLLQCAQKAANTAAVLVKTIKDAIEIDEKQRKEKTISCLTENIDVSRVLPVSESRSCLLNRMSNKEIEAEAQRIVKFMSGVKGADNGISLSDHDEDIIEIRPSGFKSAEIIHKKKSKKRKNIEVTSWSDDENNSSGDEKVVSKMDVNSVVVEDKDDSIEVIDSSSDEDDIALVKEITSEDRIIERIELTGDSEEEDVVTMMPGDIEIISDGKSGMSGRVKSEND